MDLTLPGGLELPAAAWMAVVAGLCALVVHLALQSRRLRGAPALCERIAKLEQLLAEQRADFAEERRRFEERETPAPDLFEAERIRTAAFAQAARDIAGATDIAGMIDGVGRFLERVVEPSQWMVFLALADESHELALAGSATADGGEVWPVGRRLDTSSGRLGMVVRRGCFLHRGDFEGTGPLVAEFLAQSEPAAFRVDAAIPLVVRDRTAALISVGEPRPSAEALLPMLDFVRECIGNALQNIAIRRSAELAKSRDELTGHYNKGHFAARASEFCYQNRGSGVQNALVLVGVDEFRALAGRVGQVEGDRLLRIVGERLGDLFGMDALVGRWGPDEFVVYLGGPAADRVEEHADALRRAIADLRLGAGGPDRCMTISVGIGCSPSLSFDELVALASDNLVQARWAGGNQVCSEAGRIEDTDTTGGDAGPAAAAESNADTTDEIRA